ncbi:MAG: septum formation initiator family protein [Microgenomates group bacterium]
MNKKLVNIMGLVGGIILFLILASSSLKSLNRIKEGDALIEKTRVRLEKIDQENQKLAEQLQLTSSSEFVEKQMRNKLGLAKEGEIIIVLPEPDIVKRLTPILPKDEEVKLKPNWQKWLELFK